MHDSDPANVTNCHKQASFDGGVPPLLTTLPNDRSIRQ